MCLNAEGVPADAEKAAKYFQMAADKGNLDSMLKTAYMFLHEEGVEKDIEKGLYYLKKSADEGYVLSMLYYSHILYKGIFVQKDQNESEKYLKMAADTGEDDISMLLYGLLLLKKENEECTKKAALYIEKSVNQGNPQSMYFYGMLLYNNDLFKDKEKAAYYLKKSADDGNYYSMYSYGLMLLEGDGIKSNKKEAALYFKRAADNGYTISKFQYGQMLLKGIGVKPNKTEGYRYIRESFIQKINLRLVYPIYFTKSRNVINIFDDFPKNMLISYDKTYYKAMFKYGKELLKYNDKNGLGFHYISNAAKNGDDEAFLKLGRMYYKGDIVKKNKLAAAKYFCRSADLNNRLALLFLGLMHFFGDGIPVNRKNGSLYICFSLFPTFLMIILFWLIYLLYKKKLKNSIFWEWFFEY